MAPGTNAVGSRRSTHHNAMDIEHGYGNAEEYLRNTREDKSLSWQLPRATPFNFRREVWMKSIDDGVLLSALTIPGTHDSAAYTYPWPFVSTQRLNFEQQLNLGVRYFDIRCGIRDDIPELVHGPTYLGIKLESALKVMYEWLSSHPSEALIIQLKKDRTSQRSTDSFAVAILKILSSNIQPWRIADTTPTMGELRGRIQLFRRFTIKGFGDKFGIDVTRWQDNPGRPFTIFLPNFATMTIQDHYSFSGAVPLPSLVTQKSDNINEMLKMANGDEAEFNWYINFTSAYELNLYYQISPHAIAVGALWNFRRVTGVNLRLQQALKSDKPGRKRRLGVVVMDFPEQGNDDLVELLIASNYESSGYFRRGRLMIYIMLLLVLGLLSIAMCTNLLRKAHWVSFFPDWIDDKIADMWGVLSK